MWEAIIIIIVIIILLIAAYFFFFTSDKKESKMMIETINGKTTIEWSPYVTGQDYLIEWKNADGQLVGKQTAKDGKATLNETLCGSLYFTITKNGKIISRSERVDFQGKPPAPRNLNITS